MLESVFVLSKGGVILFSWSFEPNTKVLDALIYFVKDVLLLDRTGKDSTVRFGDRLQMKWALANAIGVVVVGIYDQANANRVPYLDSLLKTVASTFQSSFGDLMVKKGNEQKEQVVTRFGSSSSSSSSSTNNSKSTGGDERVSLAIAGASILASNGNDTFSAFNNVFERLLDEEESGKMLGGGGGKNGAVSKPNNPSLIKKKEEEEEEKEEVAKSNVEDEENDEDEEAAAEAEMERLGISRPPMLAGLPLSTGPKSKNNNKGGNTPTRGGGNASTTPSSASSSTPNKKKGGVDSSSSSSSSSKGGSAKVQRSWGTTDSFDEAKAALLDMSKGSSASSGGGNGVGGGGGGSGGLAAADAALLNVQKVAFSGTGAGGSGANLTEEEEDDDENDEIIKSSSSSSSSLSNKDGTSWFSRSGLGSWVSSLTGNKILTKEELDPIAETLRTHLMDKNVAKEVSDNLCDSLVQQLEGTKLEGGLSALTVHAKISAAVKSALRRSVERILTPKKSVDLLRDVRAKKAAVLSNGQHAPFVLVFCGVNGVGKSTTLSKTAYHLKDNGFSVLIAACDSFRAGAVEQLKRHCAALDVPLYQQGYAKDPVSIASDAIKRAKDEKIDVVLIDTAGRMQNNQALMQQLARLVAVNKPDLVLFVGEALVGNDGVDQLVEFDKRLVDHAVDSASPRRIDGIVLTKFDTVDDKVGAALSMVYRTGIPVVFLGTGQQYPDLRRMNTQAVLNALLA